MDRSGDNPLPEQEQQPDIPSSKADAWSAITGDFVEEDVSVARLTLSAIQGESPPLDEMSALFTAPETIFDGELKADTKRGLIGTLTAQQLTQSGEQGTLRIDRYRSIGELNPPTIRFGSAHALPFKVRANAELSFVRLFESRSEAEEATLLTPASLPFDQRRALALPEGCVVQIPIEAQISLNFNGQLLSKAWARGAELSRLLSTSAAGFLSSSLQGILLAQGDLMLTITRLSGDRVRVRISQHTELKQSATGTLSAGSHLQVKAFPSAIVERAVSIKDRLKRWGRRPGELVRSMSERLKVLERGLPASLKILTSLDEAQRLPPWLAGALERAAQIEDPALELLKQGSSAIEGASDWINEQVDQRLGAIDARLSSSFDWIKRYSARAFNLNASLTLSAEESQQLGVMGDYILDLSTPRGVAGFEAILSGQARWQDERGVLSAGLTLIDLTAVDMIADEGGEGVKRLERASLNGQSSESKLMISAPLTQWSFERERDLRELTVERQGYQERWQAEVWRVDRGLQAGPVREREQLSVGVALPLASTRGTAGWSEGALWLTWTKRWPEHAQAPVMQSFSEILNLTGRLGAELGLMSHFQAEAPGALSTRLTFTLGGELLNALFYEVSPELLWQVTADVAEGFDNRFGLPYWNALSRPRLSLTNDQACDVIAYHWGSQYCWLLLEELIEPLIALRTELLGAEERLERQRAWLAQLTRSRLLLNPIGARLFTRLFAELAYTLELGSSASVSLNLEHPTHAESCLTERFESPNLSADPLISLEVAKWLGISEGVSLAE